MITRVNYAACGGCVAPGAIPHALQTPVATFSVEVTKTYSRVRVYAGAVTVRNRHGEPKTVIVRAGFQSLVRHAGPPTTPSRFAKPKAPFWQ
jgi:ferric-dicitrate binding protein FerR (iron transport regulator)